MDLVVLAHVLLHNHCDWIDAELLDVHSHPGRLRDNVTSIAAVGDELAEVLFDPRWTSGPAQQMKGVFASWWRREEGRAFYRAGRYEESAQAYLRAFRHSWLSSVRPATLRRFGIASAASLKNHRAKARLTNEERKKWPRPERSGRHHREMTHQPIAFLDRCFVEHLSLIHI